MPRLQPLPPPQQPIAGNAPPTQPYNEYFQALDKALRGGVFGPLANAVNDAAAAAAGVPINGIYRNGNAVQIRLT